MAVTPGTHYWHSHAGMQNADGLFGPLIIREPPEKDEHLGRYDVDQPEFTVLINDWFIDMMPGQMSSLLHRTGGVLSDSMLINGNLFEEFISTSNKKDNVSLDHSYIYNTRTITSPFRPTSVQIYRFA